jgi:hypothetical protein
MIQIGFLPQTQDGERWYDAAGLAVWWRFRWREEV